MSIEDEVQAAAANVLTGIRGSGGGNILAKCPFHRKTDGSLERHPSFSLSLTKGVYFCFACHEAGTLRHLLQAFSTGAIDYARKYDHLLGRLRVEGAAAAAASAHNPLKPKALELLSEPMAEKTLGVFDACPIDLIEEDCFSEETLQRFGVGYDEVHGRITYPIRDLAGNLMGISGRSVIGELPRYKVYDTEYEVFGFPAREQIKKSVFMWNADKVYLESNFQRIPLVVAVEGYKAAMRVHDAGFRHVVALMGSSLSPDQQWILERIGAPVCLMFDRDQAGIDGTEKAGKRLMKSLSVSVADEYFGAQPSDLSEYEVAKSIQAAQSYLLWSLKSQQGKSIQ